MGVRIYPIAKTTELSFWNKALGLNVTAEALAKHEAILQGLDCNFQFDEYDKEVNENPDCYQISNRIMNGFGKGYDGLAELVQVKSYMGSVRSNQTPKMADNIISDFTQYCRIILNMNVDYDDFKDIQWG
jgi:hypothetical protein